MCEPIKQVSIPVQKSVTRKVKSSPALNLSAIAAVLLGSMTRDELRGTARVLGINRGKDAKDTAANISLAIQSGVAGLKAVASIVIPPKGDVRYSRPVFVKKLRTYKGSKTVQSPVS